jgi:hypothetical protein
MQKETSRRYRTGGRDKQASHLPMNKGKSSKAGKPKGGIEQILWERGWIDLTLSCNMYTVYGTKDLMGAVQKDTSLLCLMAAVEPQGF